MAKQFGNLEPLPKPAVKLIEFVQYSGAKVALNQSAIVSIEERLDNTSICHVFIDGKSEPLVIKGSYAEVKERCL